MPSSSAASFTPTKKKKGGKTESLKLQELELEKEEAEMKQREKQQQEQLDNGMHDDAAEEAKNKSSSTAAPQPLWQRKKSLTEKAPAVRGSRRRIRTGDDE